MNWNIITTAPLWLWLLGIIAGLLASWVLYGGSKIRSEAPKLRWLLGALRTTSITLLAFLLLGPMLKTKKKIKEEPLIVFAQDNSSSIVNGADSTWVREEYLPAVTQLENDLKENFHVENIRFGERVSTNDNILFTDRETNFEDLSKEVKTRYQHRNLKALVIASDGGYNIGKDPKYLFHESQFPIYTIALGDSVYKPFIELVRLDVNPTVLKGNSFPVILNLNFINSPNSAYIIEAFAGEKHLDQQIIRINGRKEFKKVNFTLKAEKAGNLKLKFVIRKNNAPEVRPIKEINRWIKVLDQKQKVALLKAGPQPDIAAVKEAISNMGNYEMNVFSYDQNGFKSVDYDLVILYQPNKYFKQIKEVVSDCKDQRINMLLVLGTQTDYQLLNSMNVGFDFSVKSSVYEDAYAIANPNFSLFSYPEEEAKKFNYFPPLRVPLITISGKGDTEVLMSQKLGDLDTKRPLIAFTKVENQKVGLIAGESIWRWKLADYEQNQSHENFQLLISKMIKYLSVKIDRRALRVDVPEELNDSQELLVGAELYNSSMEKVNHVPIQFVLKDENAKEYSYEMLASNDSYRLNAGALKPGLYKWTATTKLGNQSMKEQGEVLVKQINLEQNGQSVNHELLKQIAQQTGGKYFSAKDLKGLEEDLKANKGATVVHYQDIYLDFVSIVYILAFIVLILSIEWLLRKYYGLK